MTNPAQCETSLPEADDDHDRSEDAGPDGSEQVARPVIGPEGGMAVIDPSQLAIIADRLDQLQRLFDTRVIEAEQQRQWVTQLVFQLGEYRNDFVFKNITSRIFRDLIQLYDTFGQTLDAAGRQEVTKEDLIARLQNLQRQVLKTFERHGVELIKSDSHTQFDEAEQEALAVRAVEQLEEDGVVLESARCGFRYGSRLLRSESVIVGRYEPKGRETGD